MLKIMRHNLENLTIMAAYIFRLSRRKSRIVALFIFYRASKSERFVLQVKIFIKNQPRLILKFFCLLDLIIHVLGLEDKGIENKPRIKNFNLNSILTCNICIFGNQTFPEAKNTFEVFPSSYPV